MMAFKRNCFKLTDFVYFKMWKLQDLPPPLDVWVIYCHKDFTICSYLRSNVEKRMLWVGHLVIHFLCHGLLFM